MLILVPTELEAQPLKARGLEVHVVGMGPVEAGLSALEILKKNTGTLVLLAGLAGAYPRSGLVPGDLVLASEEIFGDLAICGPFIRPFARGLPVRNRIPLRSPYLEKAQVLLESLEEGVRVGPMVTVCCATRTRERAEILEIRHGALAENMEGFAVARAAEKCGATLIEVRSVSNLLADPEAPWEKEKALESLAEALVCLRNGLP